MPVCDRQHRRCASRRRKPLLALKPPTYKLPEESYVNARTELTPGRIVRINFLPGAHSWIA